MSDNGTPSVDLVVVLDVLDAFFDGGADDIESLDELRDRIRAESGLR
ncbi:hypothetical protein GS896_25670 [Rhodococcus hoagii]|nr:hypothetical protein [Prescottella equi]MBM4654105.1 hypothetical protein [Prescottella equi]MBM4719579.1 hypothetical protein [Prescottella equi]NKR23378.1 hypothetical protein [Prescottella equi]NKT56011.1 hypothetical protein [Prescottella equi]